MVLRYLMTQHTKMYSIYTTLRMYTLLNVLYNTTYVHFTQCTLQHYVCTLYSMYCTTVYILCKRAPYNSILCSVLYKCTHFTTVHCNPQHTQEDTIFLTVSAGLCRSITLLWILISKRSQVLDPSPQGVFLMVIFRIFVGILIGPLTRRCSSLALRIRSAQTK